MLYQLELLACKRVGTALKRLWCQCVRFHLAQMVGDVNQGAGGARSLRLWGPMTARGAEKGAVDSIDATFQLFFPH